MEYIKKFNMKVNIFITVLKDVPRYDFCNIAQEIVDRLRDLEHKVDVKLWYYTNDGKPEWNDSWISDPIEYGYHTNIYIIWITIIISDLPLPPPPAPPVPFPQEDVVDPPVEDKKKVKKWWQFGK